MTINADIQKLEPGALIELFTVDGSDLGAGVLNFHQHLQVGSIWWQGVEYKPWPTEVEGFARTSDKQPTPKLRVANLNGTLSLLCMEYDDMLGAKVIRKRTLGHYLDARNFVADTNLINNGTFATDLTGWTISDPTKVTHVAGAMVVNGDGVVAGTAYQEITNLTVGTMYRVRFNVEDNSVTVNCGLTASGSEYITTAPYIAGAYDLVFTATATSAFLRFAKQISAPTKVSNVEVHEVLGNPTADPDEALPDEIWYIERKATETNKTIEFELVSALDIGGVKLPRRRIIANYCSWMSLGGYRGPYCGYTGPAVAKADGTPTTNMSEDACGGKLSDCKKREWPDGVMNYGSYPAAALTKV